MQPALTRTRPATPAQDEAAAGDDCEARLLSAWLLALLRYALTLDRSDRRDVFLAAAELDRGSVPVAGLRDFRFFVRESAALCRVLADPGQPDRREVLCRHVDRIGNARIKRAFVAAADLESAEPKKADRSTSRDWLWRGLDD